MRTKTKMLLNLFAGMNHHHPRRAMRRTRQVAYGRIKRSLVMNGHQWTREEMVKAALVFLAEGERR